MAHKNSTNRIDIGYENTYYEPLKIPYIRNYIIMKIEDNILKKIGRSK